MFRRNRPAAGGARSIGGSTRSAASLAVAVAGGVLLGLASSGDALAAQRLTCSRALQACGKPRVCQSRYQACLETGCWTVWRVRRCGYERR